MTFSLKHNVERMLDGKANGFLLKKPLLLGYTVKDCQNLGYIIKITVPLFMAVWAGVDTRPVIK